MKNFYLLIALLSATSVFAYDFTALDVNGNTIYYTKIGGDSVEVSNNGSTGAYSGDIVVPDTVSDGTNKYRVTTIGTNAFRQCTLSSLNIPIGIQEIKSGAFYITELHTSFYLPNLRKTGSSAFYGCKYLTKLQMPNLEEIELGNRTFTDCYDLQEIVLPDELLKTDSLSNLLFDSNIMLKGIKLPSNLKSIPTGCFRACWSLKYVILPDNAESIGDNAFLGCIWLKTITIPKKVKSIGSNFICGTAATWMGGAPTDLDRFGGYYLDGLYPGEPQSNQLNSIYFEGTTPPQVTSTTFANIIKANVTCYVPFEALEAYKADSLYVKAFAAILGYHVGASNVEDITTNSATLKWVPDSAVAQYTISIYTSGKLFRQHIVDGNGNLITNQNAPHAVHPMKQDTTQVTDEYYVLTMDDLDEGTDYNYTIEGKDANNAPIYHEEGSFTTTTTEGFINAIYTEPNKSRKILRNGQIFILRGENIYTLTGQKVGDQIVSD